MFTYTVSASLIWVDSTERFALWNHPMRKLYLSTVYYVIHVSIRVETMEISANAYKYNYPLFAKINKNENSATRIYMQTSS